MISGIYKITSPTGKIYVGQSVNIDNRFSCYKTTKAKGQPKLHNSFKKYGINNHIFEIIEECSIELLNERERYYQELCECVKKGLNCSLTKTDDKKGFLSQETKNKMSKSGKKKIFTKEHKKNLKNALKNRILTKDYIEKLKYKNKITHSIKVINIITGEIYENIKEASILNNVNYSTLKQKLSGINKTPHEYLKYFTNEII